jgi:hypothetical protein
MQTKMLCGQTSEANAMGRILKQEIGNLGSSDVSGKEHQTCERTLVSNATGFHVYDLLPK